VAGLIDTGLPDSFMMNKFEIGLVLREIASFLRIRGERSFKVKAYENGARAIEGLSEDIGTLIEENRLTTIKAIGTSLASIIEELYRTGRSSFLEKLKTELPPGVIELSQIRSLSPQKIELLHSELGVTNLNDLRSACEARKVRELKGFGPKTEERILESLNEFETTPKRLRLLDAQNLGKQLLEFVRAVEGVERCDLAGSIRRSRDVVSDIDIVASTSSPSKLLERCKTYPLITSVIEETANSLKVRLSEGVSADIYTSNPENYGTSLARATGSREHFEGLRKVAEKRGIPTANGNWENAISARDEEEFYKKLGLSFIPSELRENTGEIEKAVRGKLPENLITSEDIKGLVHCHTDYSDGKNTVEEMARAAEALGMKYITITDHSPSAFYAHGVELDRLQRQWDEIDRVQEQVEIKILKGTESDILKNGLLDYPDKIVERFDIIIASIHSRFKMNEEQMTRRVISAMKQPFFKIWGHPLGRLILSRPPFDCRVLEILDTIAETKLAAIEINGDPHRLDMEPHWAREAVKRGIKFVISTDAHSATALKNFRFGVSQARRGWVTRDRVLNTLGVDQFTLAVNPVRGA
jgi:DNA polymerase (family X)